MRTAIGEVVDVVVHADMDSMQAKCVFGERSTYRRNLCGDMGDLLGAERCQKDDAFYTRDGVNIGFFIRPVD